MSIKQTFLVIIVLLPISFFLYFIYYQPNDQILMRKDHLLPTHYHLVSSGQVDTENDCPTDNEWCNIPMPKQSYFRFPPPKDKEKWKKAAILAMKGEHVLLKRILQYFPSSFDFLDGDVLFRAYHQPIDYYLDENNDFRVLTPNGLNNYLQKRPRPKVRKYSFELNTSMKFMPNLYDFTNIQRAPIIKLGYYAFKKYNRRNNFFSGSYAGEVSIDRKKFLYLWQQYSKQINISFILLHSSNENWGLLSTMYPNRTAKWGSCCSATDRIYDFLNHPKTLLLLTNQHTNISHPKVLILPRGLPIHSENNQKLIWDMMHLLSSSSSSSSSSSLSMKKKGLLFSSASKWGHRPIIIECITKKFPNAEEDIVSAKYGIDLKGRMPPAVYYERLGMSKFSIALPGLGYDTFRLWESLTFGTIPILEKGVGFDKTLWRLPALLLEDFDEITPELLKVAYLEALYRVDDFEFERLTQSFWWTFLMNVSQSQRSETIQEKFPLESEELEFMRPKEWFSCHQSNSCGRGTKRIPKSSC